MLSTLLQALQAKLKFDYSIKNIPAKNKRIYLLKLIERIEMLIKKCLGKLYCDMKGYRIKTETYGLKKQKTPPSINKLADTKKLLFKRYDSNVLMTDTLEPIHSIAIHFVEVNCDLIYQRLFAGHL